MPKKQVVDLSNPYFSIEGTWYFWCKENMLGYGPFKSEQEAKEAHKAYEKEK